VANFIQQLQRHFLQSLRSSEIHHPNGRRRHSRHLLRPRSCATLQRCLQHPQTIKRQPLHCLPRIQLRLRRPYRPWKREWSKPSLRQQHGKLPARLEWLRQHHGDQSEVRLQGFLTNTDANARSDVCSEELYRSPYRDRIGDDTRLLQVVRPRRRRQLLHYRSSK
jgi:hypothetical protein